MQEEESLRRTWAEIDLDALLVGKARQGAEHRVVVPVGRDHAAVPARQTQDGGVQRLRRPAREAHALGMGEAQIIAELRARAEDEPRRIEVLVAGTAAVRAEPLQRTQHRLAHLGRALMGRRGAVVVDHRDRSC